MDNNHDTPIILTDEYSSKVANGIVEGILKSFNISNVNRKSNEEIAIEVIQGKWGNGAVRKTKLMQAGYNYLEIQKIVNAKLR